MHKVRQVEQLLRSKGCQLPFLRAYSPDLSPIENAFAKIKYSLRSVGTQIVDTLLDAIAHALDSISPYDAIGFFTHAGFLNLD